MTNPTPSPMPTEILFSKLANVVRNYVDRNPIGDGTEYTKKLITAIQSRRMYLMSRAVHYRGLWEEEIAPIPEFVDFFMTVAADFKFSVMLDESFCNNWETLSSLVAQSLNGYSNPEDGIIGIDISERLVSTQEDIAKIFRTNDWLVLYVLLQRLPLATLTSLFNGWRSATNEEKPG